VKIVLEPRHDLTPTEVNAVVDRLYDHNRAATGRDDGKGIGFVIRDEAGRTLGVAAGYTWAGVAEIKQMWVDEAFRGKGYGRALLDAIIAEARRRGVLRVWVASYDFQAPGMYERQGFIRMAELEGWPEGHVNVILCKTLAQA
jgi:ribosomal protein S18 acetylase RimI-like enzyme